VRSYAKLCEPGLLNVGWRHYLRHTCSRAHLLNRAVRKSHRIACDVEIGLNLGINDVDLAVKLGHPGQLLRQSRCQIPKIERPADNFQSRRITTKILDIGRQLRSPAEMNLVYTLDDIR